MMYLRSSLFILLLLTLITGGGYPLITTGLAQLMFPDQANGSLITHQQTVVGSSLIGQHFSRAEYFWSRPSATSDTPYNPLTSGGSNLSVDNPQQSKKIAERIRTLRAANPGSTQSVPVSLVTASGSDLDPHISATAARYQISRVANARHLNEAQIQALVDSHIQTATPAFLGQPVINVLELNLALDTLVTP